jgi:hypothetical protein
MSCDRPGISTCHDGPEDPVTKDDDAMITSVLVGTPEVPLRQVLKRLKG